MRSWIITAGLCLFLFVLPLQCYLIGDDLGLGVQGAVYRYQLTIYGDSLIPLPQEIGFIPAGIYDGKTAYSVLFWGAGTFLLTIVTVLSLVFLNAMKRRIYTCILAGTAIAVLFYLASCIIQYGIFFSGPAGLCLPLGILILIFFILFLSWYKDFFSDIQENDP